MSAAMMNFKDSVGHIPTKDLPGIHLGMPHIGLGTWHRDPQGRPQKAPKGHFGHSTCGCRPHRYMTGGICQFALDKGCNLFDTAKAYNTDHAVAAAVDLHCISRTSVFITTKVDEEGSSQKQAREILLKSIQNAGGDEGYVDLLLIASHKQGGLRGRMMMWIELEKLHQEGKAKRIGVSNYTEEWIMQMREYATFWPPQVNQIVVNPWFPAEDTVDFCHRNGIVVQAASPLQNGALLDDRIVQVVARSHGRTAAQVLIRWSLQNGCVPLPRTTKADHLIENLEVMDFKLSKVQMNLLDNLAITDYGYTPHSAEAKAKLGIVMPSPLP